MPSGVDWTAACRFGDPNRFHHALGLSFEPLPTPRPGEPTRERPEDIVEGEAWVPMRDAKHVAAEEGNFERMVRIADGTGIPLDGMVTALSGDIREDLGLESFESRRLTRSSGVARLVGPALRGVAGVVLRIAGRRARRAS